MGALTDSLGRPLPEEVQRQLVEYQRQHREYTRIITEQERKMRERAKKGHGQERKKTSHGHPPKPVLCGHPVQRRTPADMDDILAKLLRIKGIGYRFAWVLAYELNHKTFFAVHQVNSATGLVDTPSASGSTQRSRWISRRSNSRLRATLVELAWLWLRHQPNSDMTVWFLSRTRLGVAHRRM